MAGSQQHRLPYTLYEDNRILQVIVDTESFYFLKSVQFWKHFENSKLLNRTWQSMKERFIKRIYPNIMDPKYTLSFSNKRRIITAFSQSSRNPELATIIYDSNSSDDENKKTTVSKSTGKED